MTEHQDLPRGSTAHMPDLNWSQVRETVLMLELAAAQVESAMTDSNSSVEILTGSFSAIAGYLASIEQSVQSLPDIPENKGGREKLLDASRQVSGLMHQAIVAFQFYDKLTQRLAHVEHSLGTLSGLVTDQQRLFNPMEWVNLQKQIRAKYSTYEESAMFDAVMRGMPVQEAISQYLSEMKEKGNDVEFF